MSTKVPWIPCDVINSPVISVYVAAVTFRLGRCMLLGPVCRYGNGINYNMYDTHSIHIILYFTLNVTSFSSSTADEYSKSLTVRRIAYLSICNITY